MKFFAVMSLSAAALFSAGAFAQTGAANNVAATKQQPIDTTVHAAPAHAHHGDKDPFKSGDFSQARLPDGTVVDRP